MNPSYNDTEPSAPPAPQGPYYGQLPVPGAYEQYPPPAGVPAMGLPVDPGYVYGSRPPYPPPGGGAPAADGSPPPYYGQKYPSIPAIGCSSTQQPPSGPTRPPPPSQATGPYVGVQPQMPPPVAVGYGPASYYGGYGPDPAPLPPLPPYGGGGGGAGWNTPGAQPYGGAHGIYPMGVPPPAGGVRGRRASVSGPLGGVEYAKNKGALLAHAGLVPSHA